MDLHRTSVAHPDGELRYWLETTRSEVEEFVVQLYCWHDGAWRLVCQFDHTPSLSDGHDVTTEGVHLDLFDADGNKVDTETANHPAPVNPRFAWEYANRYIEVRNVQLIQRWPQWR
jgi:hypothetical protein